MQLDEKRPQAGTLIFAFGFLLLSVFLLFALGSETKFSPKGSLFAQPRTWPAIGVGGMMICSLMFVIAQWRHSVSGVGPELFVWLRSFEYLVWFMVYVQIVPAAGYLLATVIFTTTLALRLGYRKFKTLAFAFAMGVAVVVIFKSGLSVKIPGGAVYEYLPDAIRNFMIVNL